MEQRADKPIDYDAWILGGEKVLANSGDWLIEGSGEVREILTALRQARAGQMLAVLLEDISMEKGTVLIGVSKKWWDEEKRKALAAWREAGGK